jgi:hypothetical protein
VSENLITAVTATDERRRFEKGIDRPFPSRSRFRCLIFRNSHARSPLAFYTSIIRNFVFELLVDHPEGKQPATSAVSARIYPEDFTLFKQARKELNR